MGFETYDGIETAESREINESLRSLTSKVEDTLATREAVTEIAADRYESRLEEEDLQAELMMGPYQGYNIDGEVV